MVFSMGQRSVSYNVLCLALGGRGKCRIENKSKESFEVSTKYFAHVI